MTTLMLVILALWFLLLFTGAPIYALMALAGAAFIAAAGINPIAVPQKLLKAADSFPLLAAPMYILMGSLMNTSGVTERIFRFATVCVGWWKGGLCHANILGSVIFAGMSGSAVADAGGIGTIEIKAMQDAGYDTETAAAVTAPTRLRFMYPPRPRNPSNHFPGASGRGKPAQRAENSTLSMTETSTSSGSRSIDGVAESAIIARAIIGRANIGGASSRTATGAAPSASPATAPRSALPTSRARRSRESASA